MREVEYMNDGVVISITGEDFCYLAVQFSVPPTLVPSSTQAVFSDMSRRILGQVLSDACSENYAYLLKKTGVWTMHIVPMTRAEGREHL